jgi:hypothetical protein
MILLQINQTSQVTVPLTENIYPGTGSVFVFQVNNDTSGEVFSTLVEDVSDDPLSYNTFYLTCTTGSNTGSNQIHLPLPGFYHYSFYESGSTNILHIGKVQLLPAVTASVVAFTSSYSPASVFNPSDYGI